MPSKKNSLLYITGLFLFTLPFFATAQGITRNEISTFEKSQPFRTEDYATAQSVLPIVTSLSDSALDNKIQLPTSTPVVKSVGSSKLQFTDSAVTTPTANTSYPFYAIGRLSFTKSNGSPGVCTASIIRRGLVLTAGHCVHSGNGSVSGYSYNFRFEPGYYKDTTPNGVWTEIEYRPFVAPDWYSGHSKPPHATDYAVIIFKEKIKGKRIGDHLTWLGYWENHMVGHHVTVLGYPNNLDKGKILHRVDGTVVNGTGNMGEFGSNMGTGSDGAPVIVNFGEYSEGDPAGGDYRNRVVSVVSYTPKATLMKQAGSKFDGQFSTFINDICKLVPSAC